MEASQTKSKPPEQSEMHIALGPVLVGVVLLGSLVWSLWHSQIRFAAFNLVLMVILALGAARINLKSKQIS